ncbi:MAG: translation initiation factor IF-2 [Rhodospirillales bacterium]|nr:translation initiation factor IF-2 [Rhodospirillales bacterium]USO07571.1 MAG: translation initiation factor IF-2 [Rhodospirillales bacterium]
MGTDGKDKNKLTLSGKKTLSLKGNVASNIGTSGTSAGQVRQSFSGGRTKAVAVEVRRQRGGTERTNDDASARNLSDAERERRARVLQEALQNKDAQPKAPAADPAEIGPAAMEPVRTAREKELEELQRIRAAELEQAQSIERTRQDASSKRLEAASKIVRTQSRAHGDHLHPGVSSGDEGAATSYRDRLRNTDRRNDNDTRRSREEEWRAQNRMTVTQALGTDFEGDTGGRSLASVRRARMKNKNKSMELDPGKKQVREVVLPEAITVQELANRMAERSGNVIKSLMKMGVMATVNQTIDADTAELIIIEFGHTVKRVTEADVETGIEGAEDTDANLLPRPPVVTIMGHVDHGKTSLLDALRSANVVAGEAGGITQHIGAYQVTAPSGKKITFLDTPGHAAFSEMRARGANITDIVVLVVAANDGVMPQTIEAINHAKAAGVPMIVAINKIDLQDANPTRVKQDLLQHEVIVEDMGGETQVVEVSAKQKKGLDTLLESILLQAEVLDLKANPNRHAVGTVVESRMETGRGSVATVLIDKGTLNAGDIFVSGSEWGRVRVMLDDQGKAIKTAIPGQPVEVMGLNGTPDAGDDFVVVESEAKARDISEYRTKKKRDQQAQGRAQTMEQLFASAKQGDKVTLPVIIKGDVHGSVEAIIGSLRKIDEDNEDLAITVIHSGVGGITESDVSLASGSKAMVIGFNVRANAQARDLATRNGVDMRYYSIIYNVIDDVKALMGGMLSPNIREEFIGNAEIREVFNITKVGKIAGCVVTQGFVKRGAKVRLLRDDVVIHEGKLKTLKRFKDEVKEVKEGTECGMAFENYEDIRPGDTIECFDVIAEQRSVA